MELRRVAPVLGLVALLAVDAVLIAWAFRPTPTDTYVAVTVSSTGGGSTSAKPTRTPSTKPRPTAVKPAPLEQYVVAVGPDIAWVARAGNCANTGELWVTANRGVSWTRSSLPGRVMRVRAASASEAFATGGDKKACATLVRWDTTDGGAAWSKPGDPTAAWSRMPESTTSVHTSRDRVVQPCGTRTVIDLTALDAQRAWVLCANGEVRATTDGGQQWPPSFAKPVRNALAFTMAEGGKGVVVTTDPQCEGLLVRPVTSGELATEGACVEGDVAAQRVSVSTSGDSWWLLNGSRVYWSDDPGGPWTKTRFDAVG